MSYKSSPSRRGQAWDEEEELQLLRAVRRNESHKIIAEKHQRTEVAIRCHLEQIACQYHFNENRPIEEIIKFTGLSKETIRESIQKHEQIKDRRQYRNRKAVVSIAPHVDTHIELLREIRDLMKEMIGLLKREN